MRPSTPPGTRPWTGTPGIALATALVALVIVLGLVVRGGPLAVDTAVANGLAASFPATAIDIFNFLGTLPVFAGLGLAGAAICWLRGRQAMAAAFIVGLTSETVTTVIKVVIDRSRPPGGTDIDAFITAACFPSGHTVRVVVIAGLFIAAFAWRRGLTRWLAVAAATTVVLLVGCARIASHEHWPTDVVGGILLGVAWLIVCLTIETGLGRPRRSA